MFFSIFILIFFLVLFLFLFLFFHFSLSKIKDDTIYGTVENTLDAIQESMNSIFQMEINSEAESVMQDPLHRGGRVLFSWPGRNGVQLAGEFLQFSSGPREVRYIYIFF